MESTFQSKFLINSMRRPFSRIESNSRKKSMMNDMLALLTFAPTSNYHLFTGHIN